jgi:imidazoleglycerol-phosphate dehydratase
VSKRQASVRRKTSETEVSLSLNLDGTGVYHIQTGSGMFNHLIEQLSRHSLIDVTLVAKGDVSPGAHHLIEDTAIVLGRAVRKALGDGRGIRRMGYAVVPMDEALAMAAVDLVERGHASLKLFWAQEKVGDLPSEVIRHFLESFAVEARLTLHAHIIDGLDSHHQAEALFKALGRAMRQAVELDPRSLGDIPSTKGAMG